MKKSELIKIIKTLFEEEAVARKKRKLKKVDASGVSDEILNKTIRNKESGRLIKVRSALSYPSNSSVGSAARRLVKKAKADAEDEASKEGGAGDEEETSPEAEPETDETPKKVGDVTEKPANTQQITGAGGNNVLLGKHTIDHIDAHNRPGEGSVFAGGNVGEKEIKKLINKIPEDFYEKVKDGGSPIFTVKLKDKDGNPKVAGHNLVQKSKDILKKNPNAKKIMINKQVGFDPVKKKPIMKAVPGYVVDDDISEYETDMVSVIAVPSNPDYMADELQNDPGVKADMESGNSFSIATSFPGDPTVPPADKWDDSDHAIIIPNGGKGADTKNWVTDGGDDKKDAEPEAEPKAEPEAEPDTSSKLTGASATLDDAKKKFEKMSNSEYDDYEGSLNYLNDSGKLNLKDNHDKVATFLNGDDVAEKDAGISAIGKIADRPHPNITGDPVEAITGILKKAGTTPKDFLSSIKKQEETIRKSFSDDSVPGHIKMRSAGRLQVFKQAAAGLEKVFGNENSSAKSDTQSEGKTMKLKEFLNNESVSMDDLFSNDVSRELKLKDLIRR